MVEIGPSGCSSEHVGAAVDVERLPGHGVRVRRGEEEGRADKVLSDFVTLDGANEGKTDQFGGGGSAISSLK